MTEAEFGDIILKTAVTTSIGELIKTHISPKIKTLKGILGDGDYDKIPTEANFKEYLHRTYKRVSILNTLVFKNRQKLLRDIYLPLNMRFTYYIYNTFINTNTALTKYRLYNWFFYLPLLKRLKNDPFFSDGNSE